MLMVHQKICLPNARFATCFLFSEKPLIRFPLVLPFVRQTANGFYFFANFAKCNFAGSLHLNRKHSWRAQLKKQRNVQDTQHILQCFRILFSCRDGLRLMTVSFFSFFLPACPCAFIAPLVFIFEAQVHTWFQAIWVRKLASVLKAM